MTYRDEQIALDERKAALHRDLEQAKTKLTAQRDLAERTARMERELVEIEARLRGEKRRLPMLEKITVASPCHAQWDQMIGDDRVRYCGSCEKNVFNLSAMTRDEAESLIIATDAKICLRMYKRNDGTVMTEDCPVGAKKKRRKRLAAALVGAAALGAAVSFGAKLRTAAPAIGRLDGGEADTARSMIDERTPAQPPLLPNISPTPEVGVGHQLGWISMGGPAAYSPPQAQHPRTTPVAPQTLRQRGR